MIIDDKTLRKLQLTQLEIAKEIKRVCEENHIQYFLDSGTLLGAVRHQGFIPWDDDMDIGMLRTDYEKFLEIAPEKLNEKYELVTWRTHKNYPFPMSKVIKKGTKCIEEMVTHEENQGIWVDIFVYDMQAKTAEEIKKQGHDIMLYRGLIKVKCRNNLWHENGRLIFKRWLKFLPLRVIALFCNKSNLVKKYETVARKHNGQKGEFYFANGALPYGRWSIPVSSFEDYTELPFEDTTFQVPAGYQQYLEKAYGDYMQIPPVEKRKSTHHIQRIEFGE